ncbi:MAG: DUF5067 domain-containing protein, partial [Oscillospiraceae bacterium]|nr:DUF5067 domain-containing protein [Oscillospiraceae bacterium]
VVESDGRKLLIVSYKFTNKSDSDESFTSMMKSAAYQDGMELNHAVVTGDIEGYEPDSTAEKIASGKTINVQEAYVLASEEASVEVTVQEFHSESGEGVIKEFKLQ